MERMDKLKEMIAAYPNDCFSRHALALEYMKLGQTSSAIDEMEQLLLIDPNYIGTYYHLAKAYQKLDNLVIALEILEKGIRIAVNLSSENDLRELKNALQQLKDEIEEN